MFTDYLDEASIKQFISTLISSEEVSQMIKEFENGKACDLPLVVLKNFYKSYSRASIYAFSIGHYEVRDYSKNT